MSVDRREVVPVRIPMEGGEHLAVIVIEHDGDLVGLGEAPALPDRGGSLESLLAELREEAPPRTPAARCAVETARLDLQGQREGRPVAAILGIRRPAVECCTLVTAVAPSLAMHPHLAKVTSEQLLEERRLDRGELFRVQTRFSLQPQRPGHRDSAALKRVAKADRRVETRAGDGILADRILEGDGELVDSGVAVGVGDASSSADCLWDRR